MTATATATEARFQVSLNVTDLGRSVHFYRSLLALEPTMHGSKEVRFELANPPVVLYLLPGAPASAGSLNHVGLRMGDSAALVDVQRRLEEAGIPTQCQEGVECCYARQTKFWVTDPDRNLWELYVLEEDIDHSGFVDAPRVAPQAPAQPVVWEHRLTEPVPQRLPHGDGSLDEVRLEGSLNARLTELRPAAFLAEVFRVLKPGGKVVIHGLAGEQAVETPSLPGLAALVQRVPAWTEPVEALRTAGFTGTYFEKLGDVTCLPVPGLREMRLVSWRPSGQPSGNERRVLYKGPLAQVVGEDGTVYPRGVEVSTARWQELQLGPTSGHFLYFPEEPAASMCGARA